MTTSSAGTGTITLGSAETGYQSFADAGVANSDVVRYVIEDGNDFEIGTGTYTASGTTLSRTVSESSNSGAALNLSGSATVFITAAAEDLPNLYADNPVSAVAPTASGNNAVAIGEESTASGTDSISLGSDSDATQTESSALGKFAQATGSGSVSLGARSVASGQFSVALGGYTDATSTNSIAIGYAAQAVTGSGATAIGNSYASGADSFSAVITNNTSSYGATGAKGLAIGELAKATATNSIAIGDTATSTTANQIALGGTTDTVKISGAYTLPTADGSANQVLTTDGSGAVTFADAGGGGGDPDLYRDNAVSATTPTASGNNAVAIGTNAQATNTNAVALTRNAVASGNSSFAAGNNAAATGTNAVALGANTDAAERSVAIGSGSQAVQTNTTAIGTNSSSQAPVAGKFGGGSGAVALGGSYSAGTDSFAAAIANNTSTYGATATSSIAMGKNAKATGANAVSFSGENATASGSKSFAAGGEYQTASGAFAVSLGGSVNTASGEASYAFGKRALASEVGKYAYGAQLVSTAGATQGGMMVLISATTDATPRKMGSNNSAGTYNNQLLLPNNSAYSFSGTIIARESATDGSDYASWEIKGALLRDANAASTVLGNGIQNKLYATSGASAWTIALSADTTNGGLAITVTGAASTNIRWVATVNTSEVTYA